MSHAIFAALWIGSVLVLLSAGYRLHQYYNRQLSDTVYRFEVDWKKLEKRYEKNLFQPHS